MFASVPCAYILWFFLGLFGAHRFYVGRYVSGFVWLFTFGLFGVGWLIDVCLIPAFVEEHNKKVFHQQMLETGQSMLFDGEYGDSSVGGVNGGFYGGGAQSAGFSAAPYAQSVYYPQAATAVAPRAGGPGYDGSYY